MGNPTGAASEGTTPPALGALHSDEIPSGLMVVTVRAVPVVPALARDCICVLILKASKRVTVDRR